MKEKWKDRIAWTGVIILGTIILALLLSPIYGYNSQWSEKTGTVQGFPIVKIVQAGDHLIVFYNDSGQLNSVLIDYGNIRLDNKDSYNKVQYVSHSKAFYFLNYDWNFWLNELHLTEKTFSEVTNGN